MSLTAKAFLSLTMLKLLFLINLFKKVCLKIQEKIMLSSYKKSGTGIELLHEQGFITCVILYKKEEVFNGY